MKQKRSAYRVTNAFIGVLLLCLALSSSVLAETVGAPARKLSDISVIFGNVIKLLAPAAAIAFFIMLIIAGYQFMTSGGDPKAAGAARNTLTYAIIGVILVVAAWLIIKLIQNITGVDTTTISVPESLEN